MTIFLLIVAGVVLMYWLFGTIQPIVNKPAVFRGATGGLWILGIAIALAVLAIVL